VRALDDADPARRADAGEALAHSADPATRTRVRKLLADPDAGARARVAASLAIAGDGSAVPALIAALGGPGGKRAEELLLRLAGDAAPPSGDREHWLSWWRDYGSAAGTGKLAGADRPHEYTWVLQFDHQGDEGQLLELTRDGKVRRRVTGLNFPLDATPAGRDRVLVAEFLADAVTERDFRGKEHWRYDVRRPIVAERRPDGHTFIACRDRLLEVDAEGAQQFRIDWPAGDILSAARDAEGVVFVTQSGKCHRVDTDGKPLREPFAVAPVRSFCRISLLDGGRVLIPEYARDRVAEYDSAGKLVWSAEFAAPTSAVRLPTGRTLAASYPNRRVVELDRAGKLTWEYAAEGSPWQARRR
jgi:hypothetical protein